MEKTLRALFDFQRFARDPGLQELIRETQDRYSPRILSESDLEYVAAAGEAIHDTGSGTEGS